MANYKFLIPFYLAKEGGLSRATTDTASNNPSPCTFGGKSGYHTNKGVTWSTFVSNASSLGYNPSCENFYAMPPSIWGVIYKKRYWDFWRSDQIPQQSLADIMTWSVWGSGGGSFAQKNGSIGYLYRYLKDKGYNPRNKEEIRASLIELASRDEKKTWLELLQARRDFYKRLNQPKNLNGWNNAINKYQKWGLENYSFDAPNIKGIIAGIVLISSTVYLINELK